MAEPHILAIDQGTSSTKCILVDAAGRVVSRAAAAVDIGYPRPGWVEQSADQIWSSVVHATAACLAGHDAKSVVAVGLSTQRESVLLWDRVTGIPVGPVIGWQDQRSAGQAEELRSAGAGETVRHLSGLPLDPMFSALKARWLLDRYDPDRSRSARDELCLGTVDSWLVYRLVGGHFIELGNASRTQLLDVRRRAWSAELLDIFGISSAVLPTIRPSGGAMGEVRGIGLGAGVPLTAVMADSHAALFAHGVLTPGAVKATFGTGSSVMGLVDEHGDVGPGLCLTIAWETGVPVYAVEGNIRASGAVLAWAASILGTTPQGVLEMARSATNDGVDLVPAFGGLGAPWWDDQAVGLLTGLTLSTGPAQIARAAVEAIALQVVDVVTHIGREAGRVDALFVDGGGSVSDLLMQLQADLAGVPVHRAQTTDLSALGAAHLAGLVRGVWDDATLQSLPRTCDVFVPVGASAHVKTRIAEWHDAIARSRQARGVMDSG